MVLLMDWRPPRSILTVTLCPYTTLFRSEVIGVADGFVFVTGEYNGGLQPSLKNLVDHYLPQFAWRPAAIASYSAGPFAGVRAATAWRTTLGAMGMVVTSTPLSLARIGGAFEDGRPAGEADRQSVVSGKRVSVSVHLGGRRIIKKKKNT